jgi:hypothetical protein
MGIVELELQCLAGWPFAQTYSLGEGWEVTCWGWATEGKNRRAESLYGERLYGL